MPEGVLSGGVLSVGVPQGQPCWQIAQALGLAEGGGSESGSLEWVEAGPTLRKENHD